MENDIDRRRGLILLLVTVTVALFIGLVWLIIALHPWDQLGAQKPGTTTSAEMILNCTYPVEYWNLHPELLPAQMVIGGVVYKERELVALMSEDSPDLAQQIKVQLAVAFLNGQSGANQQAIEATLFEAFGWLMDHPTGSQVTEMDLEEGGRLYKALEAYNLGLAGVAACEAAPGIRRTITLNGMTSPTASLTASLTTTPTASLTPSPTFITTSTADAFTPTTSRPGLPTSTPMRTSMPSHTNTPQPPTPTKTSVPTYTPTLPATPTSTRTPVPSPTLPPPEVTDTLPPP